jgi:hypothetical protein
MGEAMKHTVEFADNGQDFLQWDIERGVVVDSRPFQASVWKGTKVDIRRAEVGQLLPVVTPSGRTSQIIYPVVAITKHV